MLFKLYTLNKTRKAWQENPSEELANTLQGAITSYLATSFVVAGLFLGLLAVLSFTQLLGGPYLLARILFFLTIIPFVSAVVLLARLLRWVRSRITQFTHTTTTRRGNDQVIDVHVHPD